MQKENIPGGQYAAALPNGEYAVGLHQQGKIKTKDGIIVGPNNDDLLWIDIYPGKISGQGQTQDIAWQKVGSTPWSNHGLAFGPLAVIFDLNGILHTISKAPASGFRYCNEQNQLISASSTYADTTRRIWEWTTLGGHTFGQGGEGQFGDDPLIVILPDGTYRKIQNGRCRAIRVHHANGNFAIGWSQQDSNSAGLLWATVAELSASFPVYNPHPIEPEPPEPPVPPIPNHKDVVERMRAKYNSMPAGPERGYTITNATAWELRSEGAGTFYKTSGTQFNQRSIDIVIYKHQVDDPSGKGKTFDILGDAEGRATPQWSRTNPSGFGDERVWREPVEPPDFNPDPEPTNPDRDMLIHIRDEINEFLGE